MNEKNAKLIDINAGVEIISSGGIILLFATGEEIYLKDYSTYNYVYMLQDWIEVKEKYAIGEL